VLVSLVVRFQMISYHDGTEMMVGDSVLIEHGETPGTITELIQANADFDQWNVDEPGVMIKSAPFGLVFLPVSTFADDSIIFVSRNET
jgi:hypothetical protein